MSIFPEVLKMGFENAREPYQDVGYDEKVVNIPY